MKALKSIFSKDFCEFIPFVWVVIVVISIFLTKDSYDFYFIADNGREILTNGFPTVDWVSIHDNLHIVLQQWVISVLDWLVYDIFGYNGMYVLVIIVSIIFGGVLFFVTLWLSKRNFIVSALITLPVYIFICSIYSSPRPQLYSVIIIILTIAVLESYSCNHNIRILYLLPLLSIIHANIHATFWPVTIGIMCLYLVTLKIGHNKVKYLAFSIFLAILAGFVNPYGWEALIQPLFTYGYPLYSAVSELASPDAPVMLFFVIFPIVIVAILCTGLIINKNKTKINWTIIIMFIVASIGAVFCYRLCVYSTVLGCLAVAVLSKAYGAHKSTPKWNVKKFSAVGYVAFIGLLCFTIAAGCILCTNYPIKENRFRDLDSIKEIIVENGDADMKTCITTNVTEGQYLHFFSGIHPYIDGRLELYIDSVNKKEDYSTRFFYATKREPQIFIDIINEYDIDYIIIQPESSCGAAIEQLLNRDKYVLVFSGTDTANSNKIYHLYKKK